MKTQIIDPSKLDNSKIQEDDERTLPTMIAEQLGLRLIYENDDTFPIQTFVMQTQEDDQPIKLKHKNRDFITNGEANLKEAIGQFYDDGNHTRTQLCLFIEGDKIFVTVSLFAHI